GRDVSPKRLCLGCGGRLGEASLPAALPKGQKPTVGARIARGSPRYQLSTPKTINHQSASPPAALTGHSPWYLRPTSVPPPYRPRSTSARLADVERRWNGGRTEV